MSEISKVTDYTINQFDANELVNTITFEKTAELDYNKENIYPLVNIDIVSSVPIGETVNIDYTITILQARNIENVLNNDKLFGSNLIDNLNETHAIALSYLNALRTQNNSDGIEINTLSNITFLKNYKGALDGCQFDITLSIDNSTNCI